MLYFILLIGNQHLLIHGTNQIYLQVFILSDETVSDERVWFLGDNFIARTYRVHYKIFNSNREGCKHFGKENFEVIAHCNSKYSSSQVNLLACLQNTLATAINHCKNGTLPKYIIIILDEDLIDYLNFPYEGAATLLGSWIQWLCKEFAALIDFRFNQLPLKCTKKGKPFFYWVTAPTHSCFSKDNNNLRIKFNLALESVVRGVDGMRVIRTKEWNPKDSNLACNNRFTELGLITYWHVIDSSFKFNATRHEFFLAKKLVSSSSSPTDVKQKNVEQPARTRHEDPMRSFFRRHGRHHVECQMDVREDIYSLDRHHSKYNQANNRFILPRLSSYR